MKPSFALTQSERRWWDDLPEGRAPQHAPLPFEDQTLTWGGTQFRNVEVPAGATPMDVTFDQQVEIRFPHPCAFIVGFVVQVIATNGATPDSVVFVGAIQWGVGRGMFPDVVSLGTIAAPGAPVTTFRGPGPAKNLIVSGAAQLTPTDALAHRTSLSFSAWAAPMVFA